MSRRKPLGTETEREERAEENQKRKRTETRWRGREGKPGGVRKATDPKEETSEEEIEGKRG